MDYGLALLSGVLLALSFPKFGYPAFAWIALVPLLIALSGRSRQSTLRAFMLGLISGVVYFVGTTYWTGAVLQQFGGVPIVLALLAMLLLALYLALFPAFTALIMARLIDGAGRRALFLTPVVWVATEYLRGYLLGGFPWVPLGNSQVAVLPVAQLASIVGVYGLSALVAFVSASLAYAVLSTGRARILGFGVAALAVGVVAVWGLARISDGSLTREGTAIRIGLIQGNIAQEDKWNPREARRIFTTYIAMTRDAVRRGAEFVIWPESSTPFMFEEDDVGESALRDLARELHVPILLGSDQVDRSGDMVRLYNAAFLVTPEGETAAVYRKIHLVPFGEYIPFKNLLYFVSPLVERLADFAPGTSMVMLPVGSHQVNTAICYEVVYPSLMRQAVLEGSQLLTTITNDGWYGYSSAPYQHFELASMRAIEQGRYLVRAANTGISGIVDPYGRVVQRSAIFEEAGLVGEARLLTGRTIYAAIGDVVAYAAIALTVVALITVRRVRGSMRGA
ncbi:MAG TPA: apolipoprotein N-acyltransferase [Vicinamibacterales bacterium]